MTDSAVKAATHEIVVDEIFPYAPETIWTLLANADLMERWFMKPTGFQPVEGTSFTFSTTPAGAWDGTIRCEVLQVIPNERLAYAWKGGHAGNVGYGSPLDTVVTWTLARAGAGTRIRDRRQEHEQWLDQGGGHAFHTCGHEALRRQRCPSPTPAAALVARSATKSAPSRSV
jgi:uncharacterized protein YndB with AHSA1/START domain